MGVVYDEVYISTKREIDVCEKAIKKLSRTISEMERKYQIKTAEFIAGFNEERIESNNDFLFWRESVDGLKRWEERLKGFREILASRC